MAAVPVNPPQPSTGTYAPTTMQTQNVYMMPAPQQQGIKTRIIRPVPGVKCLSIATIVMGGVLVVLGVVAIVLKARMSYIANPIWTGLLFLVTTGILGIFVYKKQNNFCMNIGFLVMTIISAICSFQLMECVWVFATDEWNWGCLPGPGTFYEYGCSPQWARVVVGVALLLCAIAALVLCIISCSVTMYGTFTCCYNCCRCCRTSSAPTVQYSSPTGIVMAAPMSGHGMQVMATPQMVPQHTYPHNSPPAYMAAAPVMSTPPQAFLVTSDIKQVTQPGVVSVQISNPSAPPPGKANVVVQPPAANAPATEAPQPGQIAENPQNWEKF